MVKPVIGRLSRLFDDYVEDVAVGTPWWVLALVFGLGAPIAIGISSRLLRAPHPETNDAGGLLAGLLLAGGPSLIARERKRYRAAITDKSRDVAGLRRLTWREFEIRLGELIRSQGYVVKERGGFEPDGGVDAISRAERKDRCDSGQAVAGMEHQRTARARV